MNKFALPLSILAAATLAACGGPDQSKPYAQPEAFANPVPNTSLRTGSGRVIVLLDPTGPMTDSLTWQRMTLLMNDGTWQTVDRRGHQVAMGERVHVR